MGISLDVIGIIDKLKLRPSIYGQNHCLIIISCDLLKGKLYNGNLKGVGIFYRKSRDKKGHCQYQD